MRLSAYNSTANTTYTLTESPIGGPYLHVNNSYYLPLTTSTSQGVRAIVESGTNSYRPMVYSTNSLESDYYSSSTDPGHLSSTTALTRASTSATTYGTQTTKTSESYRTQITTTGCSSETATKSTSHSAQTITTASRTCSSSTAATSSRTQSSQTNTTASRTCTVSSSSQSQVDYQTTVTTRQEVITSWTRVINKEVDGVVRSFSRGDYYTTAGYYRYNWEGWTGQASTTYWTPGEGVTSGPAWPAYSTVDSSLSHFGTVYLTQGTDANQQMIVRGTTSASGTGDPGNRYVTSNSYYYEQIGRVNQMFSDSAIVTLRGTYSHFSQQYLGEIDKFEGVYESYSESIYSDQNGCITSKQEGRGTYFTIRHTVADSVVSTFNFTATAMSSSISTETQSRSSTEAYNTTKSITASSQYDTTNTASGTESYNTTRSSSTSNSYTEVTKTIDLTAVTTTATVDLTQVTTTHTGYETRQSTSGYTGISSSSYSVTTWW